MQRAHATATIKFYTNMISQACALPEDVIETMRPQLAQWREAIELTKASIVDSKPLSEQISCLESCIARKSTRLTKVDEEFNVLQTEAMRLSDDLAAHRYKLAELQVAHAGQLQSRATGVVMVAHPGPSQDLVDFAKVVHSAKDLTAAQALLDLVLAASPSPSLSSVASPGTAAMTSDADSLASESMMDSSLSSISPPPPLATDPYGGVGEVSPVAIVSSTAAASNAMKPFGPRKTTSSGFTPYSATPALGAEAQVHAAALGALQSAIVSAETEELPATSPLG